MESRDFGVFERLIACAVLTRATAGPRRPDRLASALAELWLWDRTLGSGAAASAALYPKAIAIVDEHGRTTTYGELWRRASALANGLSRLGVVGGTSVGIMCRNHRGFVEAMLAVAQLGASSVFLNTSFAGPQIAGVVEDERLELVLHDDEFADAVAGVSVQTLSESAMEELIGRSSRSAPRPPRRPGRVVVLTSGTTGRPRGADRSSLGTALDAAFLLERLPLRARDTAVIAAPIFHAWGFSMLCFGLGLGHTIVLQREFDAERTLAAVAGRCADVVAAVPVMYERILELGPATLVRYDTSALRVLAASGSQLTSSLATRLLNRFGPVVYNLYGSTEVALATIASPHDLRAAPDTAGHVIRGVRLRLLDENGDDVAPGETGRVFVGNRLRFEGYTGGGGKESVDGLLSSGDIGHLDRHGRLFIDGRADDMIVSGGENVFPAEVEELIFSLPQVREVCVVGVPDEEFGQRLKAVVVRNTGAQLEADDVRSVVRERLARFKVPRDVVFVDALPRTATGKVLRRLLVT
jgi:fatty-acyl-CoA synthase